jgi:glyoxylase-like metal-dependent hydrolase (beta-lactamase superfamily II)
MKYLLVITLAMVLSATVQAQDDPVEFTTTRLSDTVYMLKGRGGNVGVSAGEDGVYIIDDQLKPITDGLIAAVAGISDQPIKFVINTHYHYDHVGGNEALGEAGSVIIAHDNIRKRMATEQFNHFMNRSFEPFPKAALPVLTFNDKVSLHFNGESVTAYHVSQGHTDGDSIIHFPKSNVIHMGDMFFFGLYPYIDLDAGGSILGVIKAAELAISLSDENTQIIPGHGPMAKLDDLKAYRDYLVKATANVKALIDEGMNLQQVVDARPTAEWDEKLGKTWITPAQFAIFIYNSLKGINQFTPLAEPEGD